MLLPITRHHIKPQEAQILMTHPFYTPIDLKGNELIGAVTPEVSEANALERQFFANSDNGGLPAYRVDGSTVVNFAESGGAQGDVPLVGAGGKLGATYIPALNDIEAPTGAVSMNGQILSNIADGVAGTDAVSVQQLTQAVETGTRLKETAKLMIEDDTQALTAGTVVSQSYDDNGSSVADPYTLAAGDVIVINYPSSSASFGQNGLWVVRASGAPVRLSEANIRDELIHAATIVSRGEYRNYMVRAEMVTDGAIDAGLEVEFVALRDNIGVGTVTSVTPVGGGTSMASLNGSSVDAKTLDASSFDGVAIADDGSGGVDLDFTFDTFETSYLGDYRTSAQIDGSISAAVDPVSAMATATQTKANNNETGIVSLALMSNEIQIDLAATDVVVADHTTDIAANVTAIGLKASQADLDATDAVAAGHTTDIAGHETRITANDAKRTYPAVDESKLGGVEAGATADQTGTEIAALLGGETITGNLTLTGDISAANVTTNTSGIAANVTAIGLKADQSALDSTNANVTGNASAISTNAGGISTNASDVATLQTGVAARTQTVIFTIPDGATGADLPMPAGLDIASATVFLEQADGGQGHASVSKNTVLNKFELVSSVALTGHKLIAHCVPTGQAHAVTGTAV